MTKFYTYSLLIVICFSCVDIIDFQNENTGGQLTVYGQINDSELHDQYIRVTKATSDRNPAKIINNASIQVNDDQGCTHLYRYDSLERYYVPNVPFVGIPGVTYQLLVELEGKVYQSTEQRMPLARGVDSTYFQIRELPILSQTGGESRALFMQAYTDTEIPETEEPLFIRWDILQVWVQRGIILPSSNFPGWSPVNCYVEDPFIGDQLVLYDGREVAPGTLSGQFMAETQLDDSFNTLRGFGVIHHSITEEAFDYWQKIDELSNRVGSIFETPPAAVAGNIVNIDNPDDFALGFFEVAQVDTTGTYVTPDDLGVFIGQGGNFIDCEAIPFSILFSVPFQCIQCLYDVGVDPVCINCTLLPNSSPFRPTYLRF